VSSVSTTGDYAPTRRPDAQGGCIARVETGSPASRAQVTPGSVLVAVDGRPVPDVLAWQWLADGDAVDLTLRDTDGLERRVRLERTPGQPWGIEFSSAIFDRVRTCRNDCTFCFMAQLPAGMREALYLRDDDFRLSFMNGNFITLTNLADDDVDRILEQRLSPLYVSLHASDGDVRRRLVCAREDRTLERFDELVTGGIDVHVQIVLVPGVNDGAVLDCTLEWLAEREGVISVGIVPLGYTRHQDRFDRSYNDPIASAEVIQQVQRWQFAMKERDGVSWVHLADEFYLNARAPMPTAEWYDGFPQYENGIGIVRTFVDESRELHDRFTRAVASLPADQELVTLISGVMAATTMAGALNAADAAGRMRLLVVPNRFFGGNVAVTGLLTGADLVAAIASDGASGIYLLPDVVFNSDGVTLDDMTLAEVREASGAEVRLVSSDAAGLLTGIELAARDITGEQ
jgi:putative radical SAM enzyme (TIGR03279 family)